ncbi:holin [Bifidobacterium reuteri]|nr:holin [Bifidobacterium reuteri]
MDTEADLQPVDTPGVADHKASDLNGDNVPDWLIPSRVYDILKWLALVVLPALSVLVAALGPIWGWGDLAGQIATSVNAVTLFLGAIIGASAIKAASSRS